MRMEVHPCHIVDFLLTIISFSPQLPPTLIRLNTEFPQN